jgi:LysR family cys regulon transcriptional activator
MTLQQLRYLCAIVDQGFSISGAAAVLHTSQPGISKQMRLLEQELKADVLLRRGGRIVGVTQPGASVLAVARRMLNDADNLRRIGEEFTREGAGTLVLATTHTHARYVLLRVIERFRRRYPDVQLTLRQGSPEQIFDLVSSAEADIGITSEMPEDARGLLELECSDMPRCVIVPLRHPLLRLKRLTLEHVARYPLITLDPSLTGGRAVSRAFEAKGIRPQIVMRAIDADVIKAYVEQGLGIAVLPTVAYDKARDRKLRAIEATQVFGSATMVIALAARTYLRGYMYDFIQSVAPQWDRERIEAHLRAKRSALARKGSD